MAPLTPKIQRDLSKNIIAVWHAESPTTRYFIDNPPTRVLSPSYCYPESTVATQGRVLPYQKKLVALDKAHIQIRK